MNFARSIPHIGSVAALSGFVDTAFSFGEESTRVTSGYKSTGREVCCHSYARPSSRQAHRNRCSEHSGGRSQAGSVLYSAARQIGASVAVRMKDIVEGRQPT